MAVFNPSGWAGYREIRVRETAGVRRENEIADFAFSMEKAQEFRIARITPSGLEEIPSQFCGGRAAFPATLSPDETAVFRLYYGNLSAKPAKYPSTIVHKKGDKGPQHRIIENSHYKIETLPKSGQIWHMWNKLGTNTSWHHFEWNENVGRGGDPCHWAPNCWVGFPERITNGYELLDGEECDFIDWNYVFGWDDPETEVIEGPLFVEIRRKGVVWPHPEHSRPEIKRDKIPRLHAEVVYRFFGNSPCIYEASRLTTLEDMNVFFIRNCQYVFLDHVFSHMIIMPEKEGIFPSDEPEAAVVALMGRMNNKPYDWIEHSLSNILPPKLAWYSYFNSENRDGFACYQITDKSTNIHSGKPVHQNHANLLTEVKDWSMYTCRSYSYTNQRFNPENAVFLPKGELYEDENMIMVYRHEDLAKTEALLKEQDLRIKNPLKAELIP